MEDTFKLYSKLSHKFVFVYASPFFIVNKVRKNGQWGMPVLFPS